MNSELQTRLLRSVYACVRPIARLLLRSGITYKTFAEVAKAAFVHEAILERDGKGRPTNASRVAVRTGVSRKDVRRVYAMRMEFGGADLPSVDHAGPPARVLDAWHSDVRFASSGGTPKDLPMDGDEGSFSDLVRIAGGDVPPGAVKAELLRAGAIEELGNGNLRPTKRYFVPADFDERAITILSLILFPMVAGVDHNSNPSRTTAGFIQRFAYLSLPPDFRDGFRQWSRAEATNFIENVNRRLLDLGGKTQNPPSDNVISGVGVYFFEGLPADHLPIPETED